MDSSPPATNAASNNTVSDAWDYKGRPAVRSQTGGWTSASMILVVELCERLTSLGIGVNLVTYLTDTMHLGNASAANVVSNFFGTSFILALLGGFLADTFLGRYFTIAIFTAIQASGVTVLAISTVAPGLRPPACEKSTPEESCVSSSSMQMGVLYLALYLTALGTGGLKSSVSGFGSDQFDESDRVEKKNMERFFGWFFFLISLGSLLAVTVLVYVQDSVGRVYGYGACALAILGGLSVYLAGTPRYRIKGLVGSPLTQIAAVAVAAFRKRGLPLPSDSSLLYDVDALVRGVEEDRTLWMGKRKQKLPHTEQFLFLDRAAITEELLTPSNSQSRWRLSTQTEVEEVKMVVRMLPIWSTTIMFWTVYSQMTTFSVSQATTMNRHLTPSFQIPAGSLTAFFVISILVTVPIYDILLVPLCRRLTGNPHGLAPLRCIAVGLFLSIAAMVAAALAELKRHHAAGSEASLTVLWLVPQFFLVGAGEAFVYGGQLDFFLRECPMGMKTMSTGMFLSTLALGFFLSSALVTVVHKITGESGSGAWLADDINMGRLYNFYWLLAVLSAVNLVGFLVAAKWYEPKKVEVEPLKNEQFESIA